MKKIYTFTLDGEDYPLKKYGDDLRLIAYLMYELLYNYDGDGITPLNINKNIVYNNLHPSSKSGEYYFDSDVFDNGYINYEPFLIGIRSFGLTIDDESIDEGILQSLINEVLFMLKLDYIIVIRSVSYPSRNGNDESRRVKALRIAYSNLGCEIPPRRFGFSRKKVMNNRECVSIMRVSGR